jgi:hypothetical protein
VEFLSVIIHFPFLGRESEAEGELSGIGETGIKSGRRLTAGLVYVMSEFNSSSP